MFYDESSAATSIIPATSDYDGSTVVRRAWRGPCQRQVLMHSLYIFIGGFDCKVVRKSRRDHLMGCVQYFHQARMDQRLPATTGANIEDASQHERTRER